MADPKKRPKLENFFAHLPRDCNLATFQLVNRKTLNELECVSAEVCEVARDPSLSRIKTRGYLAIQELRGGLQKFEFSEYGPFGSSGICYEIYSGQDEGKRSIKGKEAQMGDSRVFCLHDPSYVARPLPAHMMDSLVLLGQKHTFDDIDLHGFLVDNYFIDTFLPLLNGNFKHYLHFKSVQFHESLDRDKFANLLLSAKVNSLEIINPRIPVDAATAFLEAFDEHFLTALAEGCPEDALNFWISDIRSPYHWIASRNLLPALCRFEMFMLQSMKLEPSDLVDFIMMRLSAFSTYSEISFSITEELTDVHLNRIDREKYAVSLEEIRTIGTPNGCTMNIYDESGRLMVDLCFYQRRFNFF